MASDRVLRKRTLFQKIITNWEGSEEYHPTIGDIVYYNPLDYPYVVRKSTIVDIKIRKVRHSVLYQLQTGEKVERVFHTRQDAITHVIEELELQSLICKYSIACIQHEMEQKERLLRVLKKKR